MRQSRLALNRDAGRVQTRAAGDGSTAAIVFYLAREHSPISSSRRWMAPGAQRC
jgi:hypothetical protein